MKPNIQNIECLCSVCHVTRRVVQLDIAGMQPDESVMAAGKVLEPLGWGNECDTSGAFSFICPACVLIRAQTMQGAPPIPKFNTHTICPKCGECKIKCTYRWPQSYRILTASFTEHLEKECLTCHYVWAEQVKTPSPSIWEQQNVFVKQQQQHLGIVDDQKSKLDVPKNRSISNGISSP